MTENVKLYGSTLYELASEEHIEDTVLEEFEEVTRLVYEESDYIKLLGLKSVPIKERCRTLDEVFEGKINIYLLNFLKLLCEKGGIYSLKDCFKQYRTCYNEEHGILEAHVVSAVAMTEEQKEAIKNRLKKITGKDICLTSEVRASCIGGIRLEMGGVQFDGTVKNRIDDLSRQLKATV